ncbi:MAG: type II toxin-antitoxin system PemK/MazF family toxin [Proteobacteria bacterium]|nr:type II toxin-antitoxin system PemK/MazF family toxin [Pseudomonadota bacterium]
MKRFNVYLVKLDPVMGKEISKTRPAVIISPDEMNESINTVIIAPMTSVTRGWASRISVNFNNKNGEVLLDQIRSVDKSRLKKKLGELDGKVTTEILKRLREMFS